MPAGEALNFGPSAKRLVGRLRPQRVRIAAVLLITVVDVAMMVISPKILGRATDIIFSGVIGRPLTVGANKAEVIKQARHSGNSARASMIAHIHVVPSVGVNFFALGRVLLLALSLYVGAALLSWLQGYLLNEAMQRTVQRLRGDIEAKISRLPLEYLDAQPRGELLSRVTNDIDNIQQALQEVMSQLVISLLTAVGVIVMMFVIWPLLALICLLVIPLSMVVTKPIAQRSQRLFTAQWSHAGAFNAQIEETFTGHDLVTVFGRRNEVEQAFNVQNQELFEASFGALFISGLMEPLMMLLGNITYVIIAVFGGLRIASGGISLGNVQAFIQYSRQFSQPLTQLASMANLLQSGVASAERVFELLDAAEQRPDRAVAVPVVKPRGRVEFDHVTFSYDPHRPLIANLSLVAEPGQTIAIVGRTGAGKTTLVNLLMRFYELDAGRITLDGIDITHLRRADLRSQIGMVLQDAWLFGGTIRDNIAYGKPDATDREVIAAARSAYVDRFVRNLPNGYNTVLDEDGSSLSSGEKQLLTIARAFLADRPLLILDEATSSVDTRTEMLVQHAMTALRANRTSFVIAHRLSTIRHADIILVMESGRIVEQGTHATLLKNCGAYHALYHAQFYPTAYEQDGASSVLA